MANYATLAEFKSYIYPDGANIASSDNDEMFLSIIEAASRVIDNYCQRRFWGGNDTADETKYYETQDSEYLFLQDDLYSVTSIHTDGDADRTYGDTWAATDYDLYPYDGPPYTWIRIAPNGNYAFTRTPKSIKIVGTFGYSVTDSPPAAVKNACLIQAQRIWRRRDAPFGIISNPAGGDMRLIEKLDPDIELMLAAYRRID